jgi:hypothetical protein
MQIFMWLVEHNRCWTANKLARHGMEHPDHCPLCDQQPKNINHLLILHVFTRHIWFEREVGLQFVLLPGQDSFEDDWWCQSSMQVPSQVRRGFNFLMTLGAWVNLKHRNQCQFQGASPSVAAVLQVAREEALLWTWAGAMGLSLLHALRTLG